MKRILSYLVALLALTACGGDGAQTHIESSPVAVSSDDTTRSETTITDSSPTSSIENSPPDTPSAESDLTNSDCDYPTIEYFADPASGLAQLDRFCGSADGYADAVRLVNSGLSWDTKALYGLIAATSTYYGHDVDLTVANQIVAEAEVMWKSDLALAGRIKNNMSSAEDRYMVAALLMFEYALRLNGEDHDIDHHFSLWEVVKFGTNSDLSEALLVLFEFIRHGNIAEHEFRLQRDPELKRLLSQINRVV